MRPKPVPATALLLAALLSTFAGCRPKVKPPRRPPAVVVTIDRPKHLDSFAPPASREAAAELLRRIGAVSSAHELASEKVASNGVDWLTLSGQNVTDETLSAVAMFPELRRLTIYGQGLSAAQSGSDITDEGMRHLAELKSLEGLDLHSRFVKGDGIRHLADLPNLKSLHITSPPLGDGDLRGLRSLAHVRSLGLHGRLVDFDLTHLRSLPELGYLAVSSPNLTDAGFTVLDELPGVTGLLIRCRKVTDETLATISRKSRITGLNFDGLAITDAGLARLAGLTGMKHFSLRNITEVTDEGLAVLENWPDLNSLQLDENSKITGAGLAHVPNPPRMENLTLEGPAVNDDGLAPFGQFTGVKYLRIGTGIGPGWVVKNGRYSERPSHVTDAGLAHFERFESEPCWITLTNVAITDAGLERLASRPGVGHITLIRAQAVTRAGVDAAKMAHHVGIEASGIADERSQQR